MLVGQQSTDLLKLIKEDPTKGVRAARKRCKGTRLRGWQDGVAGLVLARRLLHDKPKQQMFYAEAIWRGGNKRNPRYLLLHCLQYLYDDRHGPDAICAQSHADALQPYLDDDGVTPEQLLEKLKTCGGWSGLKGAPPASDGGSGTTEDDAANRRGSEAPPHRDRVRVESPANGGKDEREAPPRTAPSPVADARQAAASPPRAAAKTTPPDGTVRGEPRPRNVRWSQDEIGKCLMVSMAPADLRLFIGKASSVGDEATLLLVRADNDGKGMIVWETVSIEYKAGQDG